MSIETEFALSAVMRRMRLYRPANAVPDTGIDLQRLSPNIRLRAVPKSNAGLFFVPVAVPEPRPEPVEQPEPFPTPIMSSRARRKRKPDDLIIFEVARHFDISFRALKGHRRFGSLVIPRQVAIYISKRIMGGTWAATGALFGRDYSTTIYSYKKASKLITADDDFAAEVCALEAKIRQAMNEAESA